MQGHLLYRLLLLLHKGSLIRKSEATCCPILFAPTCRHRPHNWFTRLLHHDATW